MKAYQHLVRYALAAGNTVSVYDGEIWEVKRSTDYQAIVDCINSVEEAEILIADNEGRQIGWALVSAYGLADDETVIDFGYNDYNVNNKKAVKIAQDLQTIGHDPYAAGFPAAIVDKQMTAQRLGVPFFQVWNGGGKAAKDYNSRIQTQRYAVQDPRNQDLRGHVYQSLGLKPPQIRSEADIVEEEQSIKRGGLVDKSIAGGSKLI